MKKGRGARIVRRTFGLGLAVGAVIGIAVFTPPHAAPVITAAVAPLSQEGLGAIDAKVEADLDRVQKVSPKEIAEAWAVAPAADKPRILASLPPSAGNLDGLPYSIRDTLNRTALALRTTVAEERVKKAPNDEAAKTSLAAFQAIAKSLKPAKPRRQLVTLTGDQPPLAAISVGELDKATDVTWQVPGMGTYTTDMQLWSLAAQNLWAQQGAAGAPKHRAVIAWMGYRPPPPPPSIEAARGEYAEQGAPNLVRDITGFRATRANNIAGIALNVVAHSYGTTLTANALASNELGVSSVVLLGSAGIEKTIGGAAELNSRVVYACEAAKDPQARLGRFSRTDPRAPTFGATLFGCDGDEREKLKAVTGHAPILHSAWNDKIESSVWAKIADVVDRVARFVEHRESFGYLDKGTESLANIASATVPEPSRAISHEVSPGSTSTQPRTY
ncbi:alpha/beta hydrolase [Leifsonia poae]|uniref:alpha/beta hydrolase n=1 Tax=Leifsonia poae TaxID=110933 RepID=UPI003D69DD9A